MVEGVKFNWVFFIFYIIYLFVEVFSNIFFKVIGVCFYFLFFVCGFGFVLLCIVFVKNFVGFMVVCLFLGVFEGGVMFGMVFFLSCFYKCNEFLFCIGIYVLVVFIVGVFGGFLVVVLF